MNADIAHAVWERPKRRRRSSASAPRGIGKPLARAASALVALLCLALALGVAAMHPLGAVPAVVAVLGVAVLARYFWAVWPGWLLALVPLIGLAPWTGWLWVEEWDLLLLASAAGGYAAIAGPHLHRPPQPQPVWRRELRWRAFTLTLLVLWATSVLLAVVRGVVDSGGLHWALYQGYQESGQALRAAKPVLALALMAPLWLRSAKRAPQALTHALSAGMLGVLAVVAVGALVERLAFAGFTNFGSEYRTTSLFWEMHVGGGALDGALALSLPFALLALLRAQTRLANAVAVALVLLGGYALLTTFSRGLYLGAALGLGLTLALWARQGWRPPGATPVPPGAAALGTPMAWGALPALLLLLALGALVAWQMFPSSDHRGLIGVCGALVALLAQPRGNAAPGGSQRLISSVFGALLAVPVVALGALGASLVDKAAYAFYALAWVSSMVLARWAWQGRAPWRSPLGDALRAGAWLSVVGLTAVVAWSWGGDAAALGAAGPLALLALAWPLSQGGSIGTSLADLGWRPRLWAIGAVVGLGGLVAAMATADTITERATESAQDLAPRLSHWQRVPSMVAFAHGEVMGVGSGRFLPQFALNAPLNERIGDYRFLTVPEPHLALTAGRHPLGPNQLLRLTQQLDEAPPGLVLRLNVRNARPVRLLTEVCERHLLYVAACLTQHTDIPASHDAREVRIDLGGNGELGERGWPRKGLVFALALESAGLKADITRASLRGSSGPELLRNGQFANGTTHWFFTSDRNHLPWHAKNLALHWYFEQGWVGLLLGVALGTLALIRVSVGSAAAHPLAPALAGALLGFFVVGVFDSLVDAARIAFLYGTLLLLALGLRATPPTPPSPTATPARPD